MANGFAGAGQSANRRRRRLSHDLADQDDFQLESNSQTTATQSASHIWASHFDTRLLQKLLPRELWKHFTAVIFLTLFAAATIYTLTTEQFPSLQHTTFRFASCFLLLAGQLALLIGWIRSESELDYKGRFRWWTFLSIAVLATAILRLTDSTTWAATAAVELIELGTGPLNAARPTVLLVPAVIVVALLAYRIIPDMQRCFESQLGMVVTVAILITMVIWPHVEAAQSLPIVIASLDFSLSIMLFSSLLLHARYVAHVNHDPPRFIQKSMTEAVQEDDRLVQPDSTERHATAAESPSIKEDQPVVASEPDQPPELEVKKTSQQRKRRKNRRAA